ncbi:hypothetical protein BH24DEI2_BH24DEI2_26980 [soil metagenome]
MAKPTISKPTGTKCAPPTPAETTTNLSKPAGGENVPLQLKISPDLRTDFKVYALEHHITASELFEQVWAFYKEKHG